MGRHTVIACGLLLVAALAMASNAGARSAADRGGSIAAGSYIVLYDSGVDDAAAATTRRERSRGFRARLRYSSAVKGFAAKLTPEQADALRADPRVASVTADRIVTATGTVPLAPGEPLPPTGVRRIESATTTTTRERSSVNVAVIDSGVDLGHPDLDATDGRNCIDSTRAAHDDNGHGTHVAGTIAARNDGAGVVGVAPGTRVFAVKVLDSEGSGTTSQVICGIDWVTSTLIDADPGNDVPVANMSLGATGPAVRSCATTSDAMHKAICASVAAGATYVVAAGNDGWDFDHPQQPDVPAAYPQVLTVTAMSDTDARPGALGPSCSSGDDTAAGYSNFALTATAFDHTIAAPGSCIRSTWPGGGYRTSSGTSMASPHVAGAVASCLGEAGERGPCAGLRPAQIITRIRADAKARSTTDAGYGFAGDPLRANGGRYYGHLAAPAPPLPAVTLTQPADATTTDDTTPAFAGRAGDGVADAQRVDVDVFSGSSAGGAAIRNLQATRTADTWAVTLPDDQALAAGTYTARARQRAGNGDEATSAAHTFTVRPAATEEAPVGDPPVPPSSTLPAPTPSAGTPTSTPATAPSAGTPASTPAPPAGEPPAGTPAGRVAAKEPAKLQVVRAVLRTGPRRLEVLAPISRRASGTISVTFDARGIRTRFSHVIRSGLAPQRIVHVLPRRQARATTGIVTLRYHGNGRTRPQEVRLRAASRSAQLTAERPRLADTRLLARGRVSSNARGVVRVQLDWSRAGQARYHAASARIRNGRWQLASPLPAAVNADIAARDGTLHAYVLFTGYGPRRMRGEMRSFEVLPAPSR